MSEDVWSEQDTNPDAIEAALRELLRERYAANHALAPARVLNLVVIVDREWKGEIANRLDRVGRYHASRTLLCAVEEGRKTLDAVAVMSYNEPANGAIGVMREQIEIDLGPTHLPAIETIVDPVMVSGLPTVLWSPHGHEEAVQALVHLTDVMLIDTDDLFEAPAALERAQQLLESVYVVDLAWLRTTPWRERIAASFDPVDRRDSLARIDSLEIRHQPGSTASAMLLAGWLSSRLGWHPSRLAEAEMDCLCGMVSRGGERVSVTLAPLEQAVPGLSGVTVACETGYTLSLDRGRGGLLARERLFDGNEYEWQVLGASRGEGGILGEGVRQALLRDVTYGPALEVARELCP
jgi:glucose-6-phosphate dehydrogenase assembly protein OpcA